MNIHEGNCCHHSHRWEGYDKLSKLKFTCILQPSCVDVTLLVGRSIWGPQCVLLEFATRYVRSYL